MTLAQRLNAVEDDSDAADRMVARVCAPVADEESNDAPASSQQGGAGDWTDTPSIRDQMVKMPESVRFGPKQTECLNLSVPADLKRYNEIQQGEAPEEAPKLFVFEAPKHFHEGQWLCLVTFAHYEYQKL
jgi:hypothetical protein